MGLPNMTLQNVTTADVLQVASQVAHLQVKVVPSDSNGTVAAYILERAQPANLTLEVGPREGSLGGMGGGTGGGGLGLPVNRDALDSPPTQPAGLGGGGGSEASGGSMPAGAPSPADPSASRPVVPWSHSYAKPAPQAKVTRVLGIAELTKDIPDKALRNDNESEIIKNLKIMSEEHSLRTDVPDCDIQLHAGMHLLVVIGHPDSVALIEQAVAALKENASKSTGTTAPTKPFDTPLTH
jgi:hypothetical protein